mgnify:CR=1 FL=1
MPYTICIIAPYTAPSRSQGTNLELDMQYVQHVQALNQAAARRAEADATDPAAAPATAAAVGVPAICQLISDSYTSSSIA